MKVNYKLTYSKAKKIDSESSGSGKDKIIAEEFQISVSEFERPVEKFNKKLNAKYLVRDITSESTGFISTSAVEKFGQRFADNMLRVIAIFFQRVVSRTPLDEEYEYSYYKKDEETGEMILVSTDKDGNPLVHTPDNDSCRYDWTVQFQNGLMITAGEMREAGVKFEAFNNKDDIEKIYNFIKMKGSDMSFYELSKPNFFNENEHFFDLEYGKYKTGETNFQGELYEHGRKNKHSRQAPNGMLRLTLLELDEIFRTASSRSHRISHRYTDQRTKKNLSEKRIAKLLSGRTGMKIKSHDVNEFLKTLKLEDLQ